MNVSTQSTITQYNIINMIALKYIFLKISFRFLKTVFLVYITCQNLIA